MVSEAVPGGALASVYLLLISFSVNFLFTGADMSKKFRVDMPDKLIEKEAIYNFVVKTELHRPTDMSREAVAKYYEIVIYLLKSAARRPAEEIDGLDNDLHVLVLAGSKIVLWVHRVYTRSIALFRRVIQYIIRHVKRVESRGSLKQA
jgi:hypothetical protein